MKTNQTWLNYILSKKLTEDKYDMISYRFKVKYVMNIIKQVNSENK